MRIQTQTILARSGTAVIVTLLMGSTACVPDDDASIDEQRDAVFGPVDTSDAQSDELDVVGQVYADDLDNNRPFDIMMPVATDPSGPNPPLVDGSILRPGGDAVFNRDAPAPGGSSNSLEADFNGDGYADLAIGVPADLVGSGPVQGGAVNVLYGSPSGLTPNGNQLWSQDSPGILDTAEAGDGFGSALAAGDFNGDGFADLAVGVPFESVDSVDFAGAVNVLYGSVDGLVATGNQLWHQDIPGLLDGAELADLFGAAVTTGDFDGDGHDDLAIGVPYEDLAGREDAGAVNVLYGTASGLSEVAGDFWHQDVPDVNGLVEQNDYFGYALAAGDFDADGRQDLAIGVPAENLGDTLVDAGSVNVLYGTNSGLSGAGDQTWHQDSSGIKGVAEPTDIFGIALTVGDFDGDGYGDLAIGVPGESVGSTLQAGVLQVIYGSSDGLDSSGDDYIHQSTSGVKDTAEEFDKLGWALAAGDFDGDGRDDLAVGVLEENLEGSSPIIAAGAVNVLYGSGSGITTSGDQFWNQDTTGISESAEDFDAFGAALASGDFNGDGAADLAIGAPGEDLNVLSDTGVVHVIYGVGTGLVALGNQIWHQDIPGVLGVTEQSEGFGAAVR